MLGYHPRRVFDVATPVVLLAAASVVTGSWLLPKITPSYPPQVASDTDDGRDSPVIISGMETKTVRSSTKAPVARALRKRHADYRRDKDQLSIEIDKCNTGAEDCLPSIANYARMIDDVAQFSDPHDRIELIQTWHNLHAHYNETEDQDDERQTMVQALVSGKYIYQEQAQLKVDSLERLGIRAFVLSEAQYIKNVRTSDSLAVAYVQYGGHSWILNNQSHPFFNSGILTNDEFTQAAAHASIIESSGIHSNLLKNSSFASYEQSFFAAMAFNYDERLLVSEPSERQKKDLATAARTEPFDLKLSLADKSEKTRAIMEIFRAAYTGPGRAIIDNTKLSYGGNALGTALMETPAP